MQRKDMLPVVGRGRVGSSIGARNGKSVDGSCVTSVGNNEIGILGSVKDNRSISIGSGGGNKSQFNIVITFYQSKGFKVEHA
jgi:hypothetical protein